jgi:predicted esterase
VASRKCPDSLERTRARARARARLSISTFRVQRIGHGQAYGPDQNVRTRPKLTRRIALAMTLVCASACSEVLMIDWPPKPDAGSASIAEPTEPPPNRDPPATPLDAGDARAPEIATMQTGTDAGKSSPLVPPPTAAPPRVVPRDSANDRDAGPLEPPDAGGPEPPQPQRLPKPIGNCPTLPTNGRVLLSAGGRSLSVQIYMAHDAATKSGPGGPLILYFHSIGTNPDEVVSAFGQDAIDDVVRQGGVVASFESSLCLTCDPRQDAIWYAEDDSVSDQLVACALQQAKIDTRRIHVLGFSAGALHSTHLALARSDYVASIVSYSGGLDEQGRMPQAPDNHVAALMAYGRMGVDYAGLDFSQLSLRWYDTYQPRGYYSLMCDHDGGHEIPNALVPHVYRFLLDHPYKVSPEPYAAMIPSEFPAYCRNKPANR